MDSLFCPSQYFVNKQNVRSYRNIIQGKLLKDGENSYFLNNIFPEEKLVSSLPTVLKSILIEIKEKLKISADDDFRSNFPMNEKVQKMMPVPKEFILSGCLTALNKIISPSLYGSNHNHKVFRKLIQDTIYIMRGENIPFAKFTKKWNWDLVPWNDVKNTGQEVLWQIMNWILKNILAPMICLNFYVTTCKVSADENKLYYFVKNHWHGFYNKNISQMVAANIIKRSDIHCLGKKVRKKISSVECLRLKSVKKEIPKLILILKTNSEYRPIVRYRYEQNSVDKKKMKERLYFLKVLAGKPQEKTEISYLKLYYTWKVLGKPKLYFVKTDLSNAFGSVDTEKLMKILAERHQIFQKNEKNVAVKKKVAQMFKDVISELRRPLLVRAGSTVYEWKRGLVQGYKYSPALSELYYRFMDNNNFTGLLQNSTGNIKFLTRVVDDYLFITDSLETAHGFLKALSSYRNVNYAKTVVNFPHESIKFSSVIVFLGYEYNTINMQVSRADNVFSGQMCFKIAFSSAISNMFKFLENRISQTGIHINCHIFNLYYNSEELVWNHIFTTFCLSANKFCTSLAVLCEEAEMRNFISIYKKKVTVKLSRVMSETLMKNKPDDYVFRYCLNHFRYLSWKALQLCAKKISRCCSLVSTINEELAKCNCIFGKWREHSSRIDPDGTCTVLAQKEICRRSDLRAIMKSFETLPSFYQFYNNKTRL